MKDEEHFYLLSKYETIFHAVALANINQRRTRSCHRLQSID
jgi:hypothetical protein